MVDKRGLLVAQMPDTTCAADDESLGDDDELDWRSISCSMDQGSGGICGVGYLQRMKGVLIEEVYCGSHGS